MILLSGKYKINLHIFPWIFTSNLYYSRPSVWNNILDLLWNFTLDISHINVQDSLFYLMCFWITINRLITRISILDLLCLLTLNDNMDLPYYELFSGLTPWLISTNPCNNCTLKDWKCSLRGKVWGGKL